MLVFLAFEIEEKTRKEISSAVEVMRKQEMKGVRWTREDQWHLTLLFFGEMGEKRVEKLQEALAPLRELRSFPGYLSEPGLFPHESRPQVLYLKASPQEVFQEAFRRAVQCARGFYYDRKSFVPHLTLARARKDGRGELKEIYESLKKRSLKIACFLSQLVLFQSRRLPQGSFYEPLQVYPLREAYGESQKTN